MMKKSIKWILLIFGILAISAAALLGSLLYRTNYKVMLIDTVPSADGTYTAILQSVGEPRWPFGPASGQLVLKKDGNVVSKANIKIANDGGPITAKNWSVTWYDSYAEIILTGEEQYDELVTLYYDAQVESRRLTTHYGIEKGSSSVASEITPDLGAELFPDEQLITAGYKAVYEHYSGSLPDDFEVSYGAKESSSKCILSEDENKVEYLVYNGKSENGKCGLYVHYQSEKNTDGTWSDIDGTMIDIYAYVFESGMVVSSQKTHWEDIGSEMYQEVTGER